MALVIPRQPIVRNLVPWRPRRDEGVELRLSARVPVERAEADRDLVALRPLSTEQARAADGTERFDTTVVRPEDADQLLPGEQAKPFARDAPLRSAERTRVLSTAGAVAVIRPAEGCRHLESNATAKARAVKRIIAARLTGHDGGRS
jgi:hypothetical protein